MEIMVKRLNNQFLIILNVLVHVPIHQQIQKFKMWNIILLTTLSLPIFILFKTKCVEYLWKNFRRDFFFMMSAIEFAINIRTTAKKNIPVYEVFTYFVKRYPNKVAIYFEDEEWTFLQLGILADRVALYFENQGLQQGDCVSLLLHNCPEFMCLWLGLSKIGVITALINTNLGVESLLHSIKVVNSKAIIFGSYFEETITKYIIPECSMKGYQFNRLNECSLINPDCIDLNKELAIINHLDSLKGNYRISGKDTLFYIYTSGTTGLPKAAIFTHLRYNLFSCVSKIFFRHPEKIVLYCPMPLYHSSGVCVGMGHMVLSGTTIALRKKFSASNYFKDCKKYKCTAAQYIGEMLRYVLIAKENESVNYSLDAVIGNGLRPRVWKDFVEKFKVKRVFEFYAATEGTFGLYNIDNTIGNIGYVPFYMRKIIPFKLIRFSEETGEPIRNDNGFCIECKQNEPGLAVGMLNENNSIETSIHFKGYTDKKESSKKLIHNVFREDDCFFNSGDLLSFDKNGYYQFIDRVGDTFRWKGENVSTTEVESIIGKIIGLKDAVVYGVKVPGTEGRAGMVSIVDANGTIDLNVVLEKCIEHLPSYAVPMFVRVMTKIPMTSTFKMQKFTLKSEGFNVKIINDPLYFYDVTGKKYVPLTEELYNQIVSRNVKI